MTIVALDPKYKTYVIYVVALNINLNNKVYPSKKTQIAHLKVNKAFTKVSGEYTNFADVFLPKLAIKLFEYIEINNHNIELVDDQQPFYGPIYSLNLVELEILKIYIKNNLSHDFIRPYKSSVEILILFNKKLDRSLQLYINY